MLQIQQVTRCFGRRTALADVSFAAATGEIIGLVGPNGAGKSTLLRLAACYLQPTRGAIRWRGLDSFRDSLAFRGHLGYLPEHCPLYEDMTVSEYLRFRARLKGESFLTAGRRVRTVTERVGLTSERGRLIGHLSLGCRRRVGVADALLRDASLLLLDDPLAHVDAEESAHLTACMAAAARHALVLVAGHTLSAFATLCTRFIVLRGGRVSGDFSRRALEAQAGTNPLETQLAAWVAGRAPTTDGGAA